MKFNKLIKHMLLNEAFPLSVYKGALKQIGTQKKNPKLDAVFGTSSRIYLPITDNMADPKTNKQQSQIELKLVKFFAPYQGTVVDYMTGNIEIYDHLAKRKTVTKIGRVLNNLIETRKNLIEIFKSTDLELIKQRALKEYKYSKVPLEKIINTIGLVSGKDKIPWISSIIETFKHLIEEASALLKQFMTDPLRDLAKHQGSKFDIVISRHPYDILGSSTNRHWSSCTGPNGKDFPLNIVNVTQKGCLVAYLIKSSDKNITQPLARILIIPYTNKKDIAYALSTTIYGINDNLWSNKINQTLRNWVDTELNSNLPKGEYKNMTTYYEAPQSITL